VPATTGVSKGRRLGVARGVVVLDPAIVAPTEEAPISIEERRADGDATLGETEAGFLESDGQERPCHGRVHCTA
jgi:hypothetical protein